MWLTEQPWWESLRLKDSSTEVHMLTLYTDNFNQDSS